MANTFLRKYQLRLYKRAKPNTGGGGSPTVRRKGVSELFTLENYRMQASIRFSSSGVASTADSHIISIYNAPEELISILRESEIMVELRAGYANDQGKEYVTGDDLPMVFKGEKVKSKTYKDGLDNVTDIIMSTAFSKKRDAVIGQFTPKETTLRKSLLAHASLIDLPVVMVLGDEDNVKTFRKGMWLTGSAVQNLADLAKSYGLIHWYQNETLYIGSASNIGKINPKALAYEIEPGRIKGIITWTYDDSIKTKSKDQTLKADFTTFLIPDLEIGNSVNLEIEGSKVTLVVTALEHNLDTHGDTWETRIVAESGV